MNINIGRFQINILLIALKIQNPFVFYFKINKMLQKINNIIKNIVQSPKFVKKNGETE